MPNVADKHVKVQRFQQLSNVLYKLQLVSKHAVKLADGGAEVEQRQVCTRRVEQRGMEV